MGTAAQSAEMAEAKTLTAARSSCVQMLPPMTEQNNSGQTMFKTIFAALLISISVAEPASASLRHGLVMPELGVRIAASSSTYPINQAEAAMIAKSANPGSTVLSVKLLPSGVYAVTLKVGGSVLRVMVDATSGAIT